MTARASQPLIKVCEVGLYVLITLYFLSLNADFPGHIALRLYFTCALSVLFLAVFKKQFLRAFIAQPAIAVFGIFVIYELLRACWGSYQLHQNVTPTMRIIYQQFAAAPVRWICYWIYFAMSFLLFKSRITVRRLLSWMSWVGFFIALNGIPALLIQNRFGYIYEGKKLCYFFPAFYFNDFVPTYILARLTHVNFLGDLISVGFFASLGLVFYDIEKIKDMLRQDGRIDSHFLSAFLLKATMTAVSGAAILLLFGRGTIIAFALALIFYFAALFMKFRSKTVRAGIFFMIFALAAFLVWAGNLDKAWKEVRTVEKENEKTSLGVNMEGAQRAYAIYKAYPVMGVGTDGYKFFSPAYAAHDTPRSQRLANFQSMNHYLQMLAEEGKGAFIYFVFLLLYAGAMGWGLFKTQSRFKFHAALSLAAPVLLTFTHAAINDVMERFSAGAVMAFLWGASLSVLRKDFEHATDSDHSSIK